MSVRRLTQGLDTDVPTPTPKREIEGVAIFATHGLADGVTTALATLVGGAHVEANPLLRVLLEQGVGFAVGAMVLVVGVGALVYPTAATIADPYLPDAVPWLIIAIGGLVALLNVLYITGVVA